MSTPPKIGEKAPSFTSTAVGGIYGQGTSLSLRDLKGRPVVLYFSLRTIPLDAPLRHAAYAILGRR